MGLLWPLIIGGGAAALTRHIMRGRYYGPFDDFLWGTLGAFFGDSLTDPLGLSASGLVASLLMSCLGAASFLLITGCIKDNGSFASSVHSTMRMTGPDKRSGENILDKARHIQSGSSTAKSSFRSELAVQKHDLQSDLQSASDGRRKRPGG